MAEHLYSAYGLTISSELECPELPRGEGKPDVYFRCRNFAEVSPGLQGPYDSAVCQAGPGFCHVKIEGIARYLVKDAREIVIDRDPSAADDAVRLFLFSTPLGALLHQRGLLALHAASVEFCSRRIIIGGNSASGKSTVAAEFSIRGANVLADDICVIDGRHAIPAIVPGPRYLMLWADAADRLGIPRRKLIPLREGLDKFRLPLGDSVLTSAPPFAFYIIRIAGGRKPALTPEERPSRRIAALMESLYRPSLASRMALSERHFRTCARLAATTRVAVIERPPGVMCAAEMADLIVGDLKL